MKSIGRRSLKLGAGWGAALVVAGAATVSGCWLGRDIIDSPPGQDAGATMPPPPDGGGCQWVAPSATGCAFTPVSCNQQTACPPSWMQANSPGSCPSGGVTIRTDQCDGMYRWNLDSSDGYLIGVCYYDASSGLLAGIDWQSPLPCGSSTYQFGTIPKWCHYDAGVDVHQFGCAKAGSGL